MMSAMGYLRSAQPIRISIMLHIAAPQKKKVSKRKLKGLKLPCLMSSFRASHRPSPQPSIQRKDCTVLRESERKPKKMLSKRSFGVFSNASFDSLSMTPLAKKAVARLRHDRMTNIQNLAIPPALQGRDVLIRSAPGEGKTLAFGVPLFEVTQHKALQKKA